MSFLRQSTSFTRFHISEEIPHSFWEEFPSLLKQYAFIDIDNTTQERSVGWVSFEDMLDTEFTHPYTIGEYVVFAWRIDTRRLSPAIFRKYYTLRVREELSLLEQQGKRFLTKDRKIELKEQTRAMLFSKILPIPAHFEVVWDTRKNVLYFASVQKKVVDSFAEYFMRSFSIEITPVTPLQQAYIMLPSDRHHALEQLQSTDFSRSI